MKKILLVYLPFCTSASPPFSLTAMQSFLDANCGEDVQVDVLDLNLAFHMLAFPEFSRYAKQMEEWDTYETITKAFLKKSSQTYSCNNSTVVKGGKPKFFEELLKRITFEKPDIVGFSIVYSSQAFYARSMLGSLKKLGITTVIGGPCVNKKLTAIADHSFSSELDFLEFIQGKPLDHDRLDFSSVPDYSIWKLNEYFTPHPIIPLKLTSTCTHQKCAFCSHYAKVPYHEYDLDIIKKSIIQSRQKHFFLIDDMIPKLRLLQFANMIKPLKCTWTCQLRPTREWDDETLKILRESGLRMVLWGVESGCERVLKLIEKGTNPKDIAVVLKNAHDAGITNVTYIMFGFPTETKEEFLETLTFLEENVQNIDLVSPAVFGLQHGTPIHKNPEKYGIVNITEIQRTVLEPRLTYEVSTGLTQQEAVRLKKKNKKRIELLMRYPKSMNFFREHMLCALSDNIRGLRKKGNLK